jgi:hypothetical protein
MTRLRIGFEFGEDDRMPKPSVRLAAHDDRDRLAVDLRQGPEPLP